MLRQKLYGFMGLAVFCVCGLFPQTSQAADKFKVLVVMSYEASFAWCEDIRKGIELVLGNSCDINYFYMDTKTNFKDGPHKAEQAYALYQEFQPDGVITADDNAQSMFVVPYLKDKVGTPVMFCGVNAEPGKYGYPASNVTGILERNHLDQTIAFAQQLVPSIKTIGFVTKESPIGNLLLGQIQSEADTYSAKFVAFRLPRTSKDIVAMAKELSEQCDALFTPTLQGIPDADGKPLTEKKATSILARTFGKPILSNTAYSVRYGALCAVIQTSQEQGETSARMLLKAMQGTPISQLPITRNHKGKPIINVTAMRALGIKPKPGILHTAELVATEK